MTSAGKVIESFSESITFISSTSSPYSLELGSINSLMPLNGKETYSSLLLEYQLQIVIGN